MRVRGTPSPHPTNNFRRTKLTPANYMSGNLMASGTHFKYWKNVLMSLNFFGHPFWSHWDLFSRNVLKKSQNQNIFEKFKSNRNLQRIPFKMMYNMSMLRHRFSNEQGGGTLNHLPLLFCKSVYIVRSHYLERASALDFKDAAAP